jgi:opacity protein-like surface antigen
MLYGTVGGVWTQANASAGVPGATLSRSKDYAGVQFGLGMETMLTPHIGARVEYLESRYAKQGAITPSSGKTQSGLIYKF